MQPYSSAIAEDTETEYRAIEATLLETVRGRWFLAEHGRRARRLDGALLEDAIRRLQASLREPPALLGQLKSEIETVKAQLAETRAGLMARPTVDESMLPTHAILKAAEDIHNIAWSLQANPFDPNGCEQIARNAGRLYAMSQSQAAQSHRAACDWLIRKPAGVAGDLFAAVWVNGFACKDHAMLWMSSAAFRIACVGNMLSSTVGRAINSARVSASCAFTVSISLLSWPSRAGGSRSDSCSRLMASSRSAPSRRRARRPCSAEPSSADRLEQARWRDTRSLCPQRTQMNGLQ